ncbi:protein pygopus-like [Tropilaelaps mercedesae]|uniref:Protein pygopus-like n=1 Tax=Tropilaelaps mercedesae TaxID=418985 RepID=A0A1V9X4U1_9ACAR|nr:protein pygopus-like [Tropilaelaps mercedesae]
MRRECDDGGVDGSTGGNIKKQGRMDGCSPHRGPNTPSGGGGNSQAGGPGGLPMCPTSGGSNLYLPPTPFQESLIAANPFDDSHMATAHLKGNLAKNFPSGKGLQVGGGNGSPLHHSPCGMCHREVHDNDQAVLCESGCSLWFHRICTGLTEAAFHMLAQEAAAEWVCDRCVHTRNVPLVRFKQ